MLEDAIESVEDDDLDEDVQEAVDKVLWEITKGTVLTDIIVIQFLRHGLGPSRFVFTSWLGSKWSAKTLVWKKSGNFVYSQQFFNNLKMSGTICNLFPSIACELFL